MARNLPSLTTASLVLGLIASTITAITAVFAGYQWIRAHVLNLPPPEIIDVGWDALVIHVIVIFFLAGATPSLPRFVDRPPPDICTEKALENAIEASKQFILVWRLVWIAWLALYVAWALFWPDILGNTERLRVHLGIDGLNLAASGLIFLCYLVMTIRTAPTTEYKWYNKIYVIVGVGVLLIGIEGATTKIPGRGPEAFFDGAHGLLAGVALALLVGRFESKFIDSKVWIVAPLYGYAVLQFAYPVLTHIDNEHGLRFVTITTLALIFKVLLFWEVRGIILSRKLTYYMIKYRGLDEDAPKERERYIKALTPVP